MGSRFCLGTTERSQKLITRVVDSSASCGVLWLGDVVTMINGTDISKIDHAACLAMIRAQDAVTFVVIRRIGKFGLIVEPGDAGHGLDIAETYNNGVKKIVSVSKACPAYGLVQVNDLVSSVNDTDMATVTLQQCGAMMSAETLSLKIERNCNEAIQRQADSWPPRQSADYAEMTDAEWETHVAGTKSRHNSTDYLEADPLWLWTSDDAVACARAVLCSDIGTFMIRYRASYNRKCGLIQQKMPQYISPCQAAFSVV